jgi:3-oxoacyl-[acyl-carrier protein] reductase
MPGEVSALPVDLADVDAIAGAVSGVGDVDVLVNAAAVMSAPGIVERRWAAWST